jgi:hypothetical protein
MGLSIQDELEWVSCCACGVAFAAPASFWKGRRANRAEFFCPNGHSQSFTESTADRLQRELNQRTLERDSARNARDLQIARAEKAERALKRAKAAATR